MQIVVVTPKLDVLPLHLLEWDRFQTFCRDVLAQRPGISEAREYLKQGNAQDGIDIYATAQNSKKKVFAQCKREKYLAPGAVDQLVTEFLSGTFAAEAEEFILCTSFDLSKHRDETAVEQARQRFEEKEIKFTVWDAGGLSAHLRIHPAPQIVYHFFDAPVAQAFYGEVWESYLKRVQAVPKPTYKPPLDHIERTMLLYNEYQQKKKAHPWMDAEEKPQTLISFFTSKIKETRIVLLSVAGFGKTQEVSHLAAHFAGPETPVHPVRYYLKDYEGQAIETLLANHCDNWKNIPLDGLLLLFDGLDEVAEAHRPAFINHLNAFAENHPLASILVTSRFNFYDLKQSSLRSFDVYVLQPLQSADIEAYVERNLGEEARRFRKTLEDHRLSEYINNPYYLTRLVRFYTDKERPFPKNKSDLFQRILFEQLDKDEAKFTVSDLKEKLLPVARKVAFCMTLAGKSLMTEEELRIIVPQAESRKHLRHFCILNMNESQPGTWTFEHKNLQEYLCASFLMGYRFDQIQPLISFSFNREKLLPRFLNTVAFLFELLDRNDSMFQELSLWLQVHQPEVVVRFEKAQLKKETRQALFKRILAHYKEKGISLRHSSYFYVEELAAFADIDRVVIAFLGQQLATPVNDQMAYDCLALLSNVDRPFVYAAQLKEISSAVLRSAGYPSFVKGQAIHALEALGRNDKSVFEEILRAPIDRNDFEIRRRLIHFLEQSNYSADFADFVLASITVYNTGQREMTYGGSNDGLKRVILGFKTAPAIKQVLRYAITHRQILERYSHRDFRFEPTDLQTLLVNVALLYPTMPSLLPLVYRIFMSAERLRYDDKSAGLFSDFFEKTCGRLIIFEKLYKFGKQLRDLVLMVDEASIDFLLKEYEENRINDQYVTAFYNWLRWKTPSLKEYFKQKLALLREHSFTVEEDEFDYQALAAAYQERNQMLLLDQSLFLQEAAVIFDSLQCAQIRHEDFYEAAHEKLRPYYHSTVKEAIQEESIHSPAAAVTKDAFLAKFGDTAFWEGYVVEQIKDHLEQKPTLPLQPALLTYGANWLVSRIEAADFTGSVEDKPDGGITFNLHHAFLKELYTLLDVEMEDYLHLKLLEIDFSGVGNETTMQGAAGKIVSRVKNPVLLKTKILENIRLGKLATWVLATHFQLCRELKYQECLEDLYNAIIQPNFFDAHTRRTLTQLYLELGGDITDFDDFLVTPSFAREENVHILWEWYLLEKFADQRSDKAAAILTGLAKRAEYGAQGRAKAIGLLLSMDQPEGLSLWVNYVKTYGSVPSDHTSVFQEFITRQLDLDVLSALLDVLDYSFANRLFDRSYRSIQEFVYSLLVFIPGRSQATFNTIKEEVEELIEKYRSEEFVYGIKLFLERLHQSFYESHEYEISVIQAVEYHEQLSHTGGSKHSKV